MPKAKSIKTKFLHIRLTPEDQERIQEISVLTELPYQILVRQWIKQEHAKIKRAS